MEHVVACRATQPRLRIPALLEFLLRHFRLYHYLCIKVFQRYDYLIFAFYFFTFLSVDTTQKARCHPLRFSCKELGKVDTGRFPYFLGLFAFLGHDPDGCVRRLTIDGSGPKISYPFSFCDSLFLLFSSFLSCWALDCLSHIPLIDAALSRHMSSFRGRARQDSHHADPAHSMECDLVATCLGTAQPRPTPVLGANRDTGFDTADMSATGMAEFYHGRVSLHREQDAKSFAQKTGEHHTLQLSASGLESSRAWLASPSLRSDVPRNTWLKKTKWFCNTFSLFVFTCTFTPFGTQNIDGKQSATAFGLERIISCFSYISFTY